MQNLDDLSPNERKAKLLEFLINQRRIVSTDTSFEDGLGNSKSYDDNSRYYNERYGIGSGNANNKNISMNSNLNFAPYGIMANKNKSPNESLVIAQLLPPVKKNYYLAHSMDLSHPDSYVNIKINNNNAKQQKDDVFYDNKKD